MLDYSLRAAYRKLKFLNGEFKDHQGIFSQYENRFQIFLLIGLLLLLTEFIIPTRTKEEVVWGGRGGGGGGECVEGGGKGCVGEGWV